MGSKEGQTSSAPANSKPSSRHVRNEPTNQHWPRKYSHLFTSPRLLFQSLFILFSECSFEVFGQWIFYTWPIGEKLKTELVSVHGIFVLNTAHCKIKHIKNGSYHCRAGTCILFSCKNSHRVVGFRCNKQLEWSLLAVSEYSPLSWRALGQLKMIKLKMLAPS